MDATETVLALAAAAAAGFVVGAEREQHTAPTMAGARTFPLFALAGALGMLLGPVALAILGLAVATLIAVAYLKGIEADFREGIGMSTEVAALVTFALGALCTAEQLPLALTERLLIMAAATTGTLALLSFKERLHYLVGRVSREDLYATTKLLLILLVVLPLLPDADLGPYGAFNPRHLGVLVLLIASIGFAGYVAMRVLGPRRGLGLTGLLGGLVSSTAVTLTFAGRAREVPAIRSAAALAIVLACSTMFPRVLLEVYAVSPPLGAFLLWPCALGGVVGVASAGLLYARVEPETRAPSAGVDLQLQNPFSIASAIKFVAVFAVVLTITYAAKEHLGERGTYVAAVLSGVTDVDAITLSLARMHGTGAISAEVASGAIGLAVLTNTLVKAGLSFALGGRRLGLAVGGAMLAPLAAGAAGLLLG